MMIMSQDKRTIITIENLCISIDDDYNEIFAKYSNMCISLGMYKSEERCKEIIQGIVNWYNSNKYYEVCNSNFRNNYNAVYYMPEE